MKTLKRITALVSSLAIMASMAISVSAATEVDPVVTLSSTVADNTVTINFNTPETTITSGTAFVTVPEVLKSYIESWTWTTTVPNLSITADTKTVKSTNSGKEYISASFGTGSSGAQPVSGVYATLAITLKGEIPADVAEADRTIVMGGEHFSMKKYACSVGSSYSRDAATSNATKFPSYYWNISAVDGKYAAANCVVVPAAKANDPVTATVVGDTLVGDKETEGDEADTTDKAAAILGTPVAPESVATSLVWTVTDTSDVTKTFKQAVNVEGGAEYTFGLVLRNITADLIKTVSAAFAQ